MTTHTRTLLLIVSLALLLTACSESSTEPAAAEDLAAGDIVNFDLSGSIQVEDVAKSALDITNIPLQVMIEARIVEAHVDFLDILILPTVLTDVLIDGSTGTIAISDDPQYSSWCCLSRRNAQGELVGTTSGALNMVIQVGDSPTVMIGGTIVLEDDSENPNRLIPMLGSIPVAQLFFNSVNHDVRTTELIIVLTSRIITDLE